MINVRKMRSLDEDFIYHSWLSSLDRHVPGCRRMARTLIDHCVKEGTIHVACSDDDDHILGWLAYGDDFNFPVLHYVFVKKDLRDHKVGKTLLNTCLPQGSDPILTSFWSYWCRKYGLKHKWNLKYNSLLLPSLIEMIHAEAKPEREDISKKEGDRPQALHAAD